MIFLPTDTVYGIGARLSDRAEYERIYAVKKRDGRKPLALVLKSFEDIARYALITPEQLEFLKQYPFPLTLLAPRKDSSLWPEWVRSDSLYETVGIRVWGRCGGTISTSSQLVFSDDFFPLWLTSANESWERECLTLDECRSVFGDLLTSSDLLIEGECAGGKPSNIFRFTGKWCEVEYTRRNYF